MACVRACMLARQTVKKFGKQTFFFFALFFFVRVLIGRLSIYLPGLGPVGSSSGCWVGGLVGLCSFGSVADSSGPRRVTTIRQIRSVDT